MKKNRKITIVFMILFMILWTIAAPIEAEALTILDVDLQEMVLGDANRQLVSGIENTKGAVYKYMNVVTTKEGTDVDVVVTIEDIDGAALVAFDDSTYHDNRFEPKISSSKTDGHVKFKFEFFERGTSNEVHLFNFYLTGVDVDGYSSYQEYHELKGQSSFMVDKDTWLTVTNEENGFTRFSGRTSSLSGIEFDDTCSYIGEYQTPVKEVEIKLGNTADSSGQRYFSVNFGNSIGAFSSSKDFYTVSYDGNGNTDGSQPLDDNTYENGDSVDVKGNTGSLEKEGYTFEGWNSSADGSGTTYAPGDSFSMGSSNKTLYAEWTAVDYSVTYDSNGSTGGSAPTDGNIYHITDEVTVSGNTGNLEKTDHVFTGWNTKADGTGTNYEADDTFKMGSSDLTLYAKWKEEHGVTYDPNGSTGGTVPVDNGRYIEDDAVTVKGNPGNLERTGYTFQGWNTQADGMGSSYGEDDTLDMLDSDMTLYAQWQPIDYSVTYHGNGNTDGSVPADNKDYNITDEVTVEDNRGSLERTGYSFNGWNTEADGSGTGYSAGDTFNMEDSDINLHAMWTAIDYSVTYDGNTSTGGSAPSDANAYNITDQVRVAGNTGNLEKTGYSFQGWNTQADGSGTGYQAQDTFKMGGSDLTLYAVWKEEHGVTYDGNGSTGGTVPVDGGKYVEDDEVTVLGNPGNLVRTGYSLEGWNTKANGKGTSYGAADTFNMVDDDVILYAVWLEEEYYVSYGGNGNTGGTVPTDNGGYNKDDTVRVIGNTGDLEKTGYGFDSWNTQADGKGDSYEGDDIFEMGYGDVILYAVYVNTPPSVDDYSYTINRNASMDAMVMAEDEESTSLTYEIGRLPVNGSLEIDEESGLWSYVPNADYTGMDTFEVIVDDGYGGKVSSNISMEVLAPSLDLEGNITDQDTGDPVEDATVSLKDPVGNEVASTTTDSNGDYGFEDLPEGVYVVIVTHPEYTTGQVEVNMEKDSSPGGNITTDFELADFSIELTADPSSLLGNGLSTSTLTALVRDRVGNPVEGVEVVFSADEGTFPDGDNAVTGSQGKASVVFRSSEITGVIPQVIPVVAEVDDNARNLHARDEIQMLFEPGVIAGVVKDNNTGEPVTGAIVVVTKDFNGDGITDFRAQVTTGQDGSYSIAMPKGNEEYDIKVTKPVSVDGETIEVDYEQSVTMGVVSGAGNEEYHPDITATGVLIVTDLDGSSRLLTDLGNYKFEIRGNGGSVYEDAVYSHDQGVFRIENLNQNESYTLHITYEPEEGVHFLAGRAEITISDDGEMLISEIHLVDPFGVIRDSSTGDPIEGARTRLYYADTARNSASGRTAGELVDLPAISGFEPSDNDNPQYSDDEGRYAWMVYPETDYYIVSTKTGYHNYTSETISVEWDIVEWNFSMDPRPSSPGGSSGSSGPSNSGDEIDGGATGDESATSEVERDLAVKLESDKMAVEDGKEVLLTIKYFNKTDIAVESASIQLAIPEGWEVVDSETDYETLVPRTLVWNLGELTGNEKDEIVLGLRVSAQADKEEVIKLTAEIKSGQELVKLHDDSSTLGLMTYPKDYQFLYKRYIKGYPDNTVRPNNNITRAEIAAIFARMLDLEDSIQGIKIYEDVDTSHWAHEYIEGVTQVGLFGGYADKTFAPDKPITRGELATVIARYLEIERDGYNAVENTFSDIGGHWSESNIEELMRYHITKGYVDGSFKADQNIIRVEAITMINRMLYRGELLGVESSFKDLHEDFWGFGQMQQAINTHISRLDEDGKEVLVRVIDEPLW